MRGYSLLASHLSLLAPIFVVGMLLSERLVAAHNVMMQNVPSVQAAFHKAEEQKVVRLPAPHMGDLLGYSIKHYQLTAYKEGRWHNIAFQIEEYDLEGNSYFPELEVGIDGKEHHFDSNDQLLFMLSDTGEAAGSADIFRQKKQRQIDADALNIQGSPPIKVSEIIVDAFEGKKYVYLWVLPKSQPVKPYVTYDLEAATITTPFYQLESNPKNLLEWRRFFYNSYEDKHRESLVDSLRMRVTGKVLANLARLTLTDKNLKAHLVNLKEGPISITLLLKTEVQVAKIPVGSIWLMLTHYPSQIYAKSRATTLKIVPWLFRDVKMSLSLDANDLRGSEVYTALLSHEPGLVDGKGSRHELDMIKKGINRQNNWILLRSPKNFQILTHLMTSSEYPDVEVELIYRDDAKYGVQSERYLGQLPNVGYLLSNIPMDAVYHMRIEIYFSDFHTAYNIPTFVEYARRPTKVWEREIRIEMGEEGSAE